MTVPSQGSNSQSSELPTDAVPAELLVPKLG